MNVLVKIKSIVAVCKIYDFGYFTYKHMRFVKACQPTAAQITTATTTTTKKTKKNKILNFLKFSVTLSASNLTEAMFYFQ